METTKKHRYLYKYKCMSSSLGVIKRGRLDMPPFIVEYLSASAISQSFIDSPWKNTSNLHFPTMFHACFWIFSQDFPSPKVYTSWNNPTNSPPDGIDQEMRGIAEARLSLVIFCSMLIMIWNFVVGTYWLIAPIKHDYMNYMCIYIYIYKDIFI